MIENSSAYILFGSSTNSTFSTASGNFIVIVGFLYKSYFTLSVNNLIPSITSFDSVADKDVLSIVSWASVTVSFSSILV